MTRPQKAGMRPMLPTDVPLLAEIFRASIEELTADDYSEAQQQAWASAADDEEDFGARLAGELTLVATHRRLADRLCGARRQYPHRHALRAPGRGRAGRRRMLCDALEKLAAARGSKELTVEASDTARGFFERRGFVARPATPLRLRRMARQHHDDQAARRPKGGVMKRDDLPFQRHWIYYLVLKYAVIAAAVVVTLPVFRLYSGSENDGPPNILRHADPSYRDRADRHPGRGRAGVELLSLVRFDVSRATLFVRYHAARRRADERRRLHARRQDRYRAHARRTRR